MNSRPVRAWAVAVLVVLLAACGKPLSVEQRVISEIRDMEARIEEGERRAFLAHIADDFTGQDGMMTREQVRAMVVFQLNRHKNLQAQLFPIRVSEQGEGEATAKFRALVTGGESWIPENGQLFEFETGWRLIGDEWMLVSANWTPVTL